MRKEKSIADDPLTLLIFALQSTHQTQGLIIVTTARLLFSKVGLNVVQSNLFNKTTQGTGGLIRQVKSIQFCQMGLGLNMTEGFNQQGSY